MTHVADSYCERCGAHYVFSRPAPQGFNVKSARILAKGFRNFVLNDGRALTAEGYALPTGERLSITGGIGEFSGAAGSLEEGPFGTNATSCPNFRVTFHIQSGSVRGASGN